MRLFARRFLATLALTGGILSGAFGLAQAVHHDQAAQHNAAQHTVASRDWWW